MRKHSSCSHELTCNYMQAFIYQDDFMVCWDFVRTGSFGRQLGDIGQVGVCDNFLVLNLRRAASGSLDSMP